MSSFFGYSLFFLLCFFALSFGHEEKNDFVSQHSSLLDEIINKHYQKYLERISPEKRDRISQTSLEEANKRFSYKCVHDNITSSIKSKLSNLKPNGEASQPLKRDEPSSLAKRAFRTIKFEPVFILGNDNYACETVGQRVPIDAPSTSGLPPCDESRNVVSECVYTCTSVDVQTNDLVDLIQNSVSEAVLDFFTAALEVDHTSTVKLNRIVWEEFSRVCFLPGVPIPESYITSGLPNDADYLVHFIARPCGSSGTVAYAAACNFDWDQTSNDRYFGRPKAGIVNFCPRHFVQFEGGSYSLFEFAGAVKVGVHEFTHALGFSNFFYPSYVDKNGDPYRFTTKTDCDRGKTPSGQSFERDLIKLKTPRVVEVARDHFDCGSLDGIELEDIGGAGTAGSHWEKRVVGDEYMSGFVNPSMPVSYLTLSLFEDMGFYRTNFETAEYWGWGKNLGCKFVEDRCSSSTWNADGYWCTNSNTRGCTGDRKAIGRCIFQRAGPSEQVPPEYQHFDDPSLYGDIIADGCPYIGANLQYCQDSSLSAPGQVFEADSRCWPYTPESSSTEDYACWRHTCDSGVLKLHVGSNTFDCPANGGDIQVSGTGTVNCPPYSLFCVNPSEPSGNLDIANKDTSTPCSGDGVTIVPSLFFLLLLVFYFI